MNAFISDHGTYSAGKTFDRSPLRKNQIWAIETELYDRRSSGCGTAHEAIRLPLGYRSKEQKDNILENRKVMLIDDAHLIHTKYMVGRKKLRFGEC